MKRTRALGALPAVTALGLTLTACSRDRRATPTTGAAATDEVVLVTHESFVLPKKLIRQFEDESGYDLVVRAAGDAGTLTNKLVLTKDDPTGDVAFGVDNTFASRALDEGVFAPYDVDAARRAPTTTRCPATTTTRSRRSTTATSASTSTTPGSPTTTSPRRPTLDDLTDPAYEDLFVTARRGHQLAGHGVPARHRRGVRRRLAGLLGRPDGQRRAAHRRAGRTPTRSTSPRAAARATARSCCPTTPRRRSPCRGLGHVHDQRAARHLLPPGRVRRRARRRRRTPTGAEALVRLPARARRCRPRCPRACTSSRSSPARSCPPTWASFAEQPTEPYAVDPAEVAANRDEWLREWSDVTSR